MGPQGPAGKDGKDGVSGPRGPAGPQGPAGVPGVSGPPGPSGKAGKCGPKGPKGPEGFPGLAGSDGLDGAPGAPGQQAAPQAIGVVFARHSQTDSNPGCPAGTVSLWSGYSLLHTTGNNYHHAQDLGSAGSCVKKFNTMPTTFCGND